MKAKIEYLKKNFDQGAVLGVMTKVTLGQFPDLTIDDKPVIEAIRRSKIEFNNLSLEQIGDELSTMGPNSINGFINNVQGILHEVEWVNIENSDGDSIMAGMFPDTNHKDYDIWVIDSSSGELWTEQLKATSSKSDVRNWINEHPDGTIRVDEDMAKELDLPSTGLNREELRVRIEDVVEKLKDSSEDDIIWDYFPGLTAISVSFIVWELFKRYKKKEISESKFKQLVLKATGLKMAKIALLMMLLTIPLVDVLTGTAIIYNLISSARKTLD